MRKILFILITALVAFGCSSDKSSVVEETAEVSSTTETTMTATEEEVVEEEVVEEEVVEEEVVEEEVVEEEVVEEEVVEEETTSACDSWDADPKVTVGWPGSSGDFSGPSIQETARIGAHDGYDRWVLEFRPGSTPPTGWEIWWTGNYINSDVGEESFDPTEEVEGLEYLTIRMLSSSGWALPEEEWYDGPRDLYGSDAGTSNLMQASLMGDFEGYSTWAIGVDHEAPFNVYTLAEPSRLVIDICH
jgi:ABC-type glycerol-3-phosphate transport system substrate-binding protein